jgi:hypothetical protein
VRESAATLLGSVTWECGNQRNAILPFGQSFGCADVGHGSRLCSLRSWSFLRSPVVDHRSPTRHRAHRQGPLRACRRAGAPARKHAERTEAATTRACASQMGGESARRTAGAMRLLWMRLLGTMAGHRKATRMKTTRTRPQARRAPMRAGLAWDSRGPETVLG